MSSLPFLLATSICQTLFEAGYVAYFAGGWVRDFLLSRSSEEIDIATNATPATIKSLFPKTIPIGESFGVVIVVINGINFEVTTFRQDEMYSDGRHPDNVAFSTPEEDAKRRDFTINGLFYDPLSEKIYDFVNGREDIENRIIRAIGDPEKRFSEDRLRMLRAVRFSITLDFVIEGKTKDAVKRLAHTLFPSVSIERIWQELNKMAASSNFDQALLLMNELNLLKVIFPNVKDKNLKKFVDHFHLFPKDCPTILFLMELLPEDFLSICDYLKVSNEEKKLVLFFIQSMELFERKDIDLYQWAHFYAHPLSDLFLQIKIPLKAIKEHLLRKTQLENHIERIKSNKHVVTAKMLQERGVVAGKRMGELIREADKISINENIENPELIIDRLIG